MDINHYNLNKLKQLAAKMKDNEGNLTIEIKLASNQLDSYRIIYNNHMHKRSSKIS